MSASCVRARAERATSPEGVELANLFCEQAKVRIEELFDGLWRNTDALDVSAAKKVLDGAYTGLEGGVLPIPGEGEWVSTWEPGPSTQPDVRRRVPRAPAAP
jgi:hypothetical protein